MSNKQLLYYLERNINPVEIEKTESGGLSERHTAHRLNLFENHFRIPTCLLAGKKILEFGPCGGENAVILAMVGAEITLCEPNENMYDTILDNFENAGCSSSLREIVCSTIESYDVDSSKYDIVLAEGFLHALPNRVDAIKKLATNSSGLVVFTYMCRYGTFFEALKRYVFKKATNLDGFESELSLATRLFKKQFDALGTSRSFESWVNDIIKNPVAESKSLDSFDEIYSGISGLGFDYYSGSPAYDDRHMYKWYKNIAHENIVECWRKNLSFFITGKTDILLCEKEIDLVAKLTGWMLDYSCGLDCNLDVSLELLFGETKADVLQDVKKILSHNGNLDDFRALYTSSKSRSLWGMPQHYVVLRKIF